MIYLHGGRIDKKLKSSLNPIRQPEFNVKKRPLQEAANGEGFGKVTAGYGSRQDPAKGGGKIGPEFTFGLTMEAAFDETLLLIKTAWGGKSLHTDFRPASAGPYQR